MEGYNNNNNNNNNQGFFGRPQGVWESEFPVGNSFLLRGTEKKTHPLKWSGNNEPDVSLPPRPRNFLHQVAPQKFVYITWRQKKIHITWRQKKFWRRVKKICWRHVKKNFWRHVM